MRILFDHGVPTPLRDFLAGQRVSTAHELGWSALGNAQFLNRAEREFDVLISTDRSLGREQNRGALRLAILVLPTGSWPRIQRNTEVIAMALASVRAGQYIELRF